MDKKGISKNEYINQIATEVESYSKRETQRIEKALNYAHDIRKFEIEMYWKRASYFWVFIAAIYAAYGWSLNFNEDVFSLYIASLGVITTSAWFYINEGSKSWQSNWENQVDLLEDYVCGPLYKTVIYKQSTPIYSVSKLNQWLSFLSICMSYLVLVYELDKVKISIHNNFLMLYFPLVLISIATYMFLRFLVERHLHKKLPFISNLPFFTLFFIPIPVISLWLFAYISFKDVTNVISLFIIICFILLFSSSTHNNKENSYILKKRNNFNCS